MHVGGIGRIGLFCPVGIIYGTIISVGQRDGIHIPKNIDILRGEEIRGAVKHDDAEEFTGINIYDGLCKEDALVRCLEHGMDVKRAGIEPSSKFQGILIPAVVLRVIMLVDGAVAKGRIGDEVFGRSEYVNAFEEIIGVKDILAHIHQL